MKLVQLLSGAAAVALIAGAASAQTVTVDGTSAIAEDNIVAAEFEGALAGNLILNLDMGGAFAALGAGGEVDMIITLTNADFTGIVTDDPTFTDVSCNFDIQSGGGAGGTSVTFRSTEADLQTCTNGAGTDATDLLTLPIEVTTLGSSVDVSVQFVRNAGSAGYTGGTTAFDIIDYTAATGYTFTANADTTELLVTGGTLINWSAGALAGDEGFLGTFAADAFTDTDAGAGGIQAPTVDVAGTPLASYDTVVTDNNEIVFSFTDVTNITSITPTAGGCAAPDAVANTVTCTFTGAQVNTSNGAPIGFTMAISAGAAVVAPQTIGVTFTPEAEANWAEAGAANASFAVLDEDDGVFTSIIATEFPWASLRDTGGTKSAFRITGLLANPTAINVILNSTYARTGATAPTVATADILSVADVQADPLNAGQFIATFTSEDIAGVLGTSGGVNADLQFSVVLPDGTGVGALEAHRLLSTGGVVSGTGFDN